MTPTDRWTHGQRSDDALLRCAESLRAFDRRIPHTAADCGREHRGRRAGYGAIAVMCRKTHRHLVLVCWKPFALNVSVVLKLPCAERVLVGAVLLGAVASLAGALPAPAGAQEGAYICPNGFASRHAGASYAGEPRANLPTDSEWSSADPWIVEIHDFDGEGSRGVTFTVTIHWGDGTSDTVSSFPVTHEYSRDAPIGTLFPIDFEVVGSMPGNGPCSGTYVSNQGFLIVSIPCHIENSALPVEDRPECEPVVPAPPTPDDEPSPSATPETDPPEFIYGYQVDPTSADLLNSELICEGTIDGEALQVFEHPIVGTQLSGNSRAIRQIDTRDGACRIQRERDLQWESWPRNDVLATRWVWVGTGLALLLVGGIVILVLRNPAWLPPAAAATRSGVASGARWIGQAGARGRDFVRRVWERRAERLSRPAEKSPFDKSG